MSTTKLAWGFRIGAFILAEISAVSASAITILLAYIAYSTVSIRSGSRRRWRIKSPVHLFLLNQLVCDLIQALGGLMNLKWTFDGIVQKGPFCVAQGLIKQVSDVGTALSAGNVAIYTFSTLIFRLKPDTNMFRALLIVSGIWIVIILDVAINVGINGASRFYGPSNYWCWIAKEFHVQQTYADFMTMWISAFSSLLAYVAVFLVLKGFISVEGWRVRWTYGQVSPDISPSHDIQAYKMLAYPIIYIITVIPVAAARYRTFAGHSPPFAVTVFADALFLSSGLLNVLLYLYTRPILLPHTSDSPDNQSIAIHSEFEQSRSDLPDSTILDKNPIVERDPSLMSADPVYDAPEKAHLQHGTLPIEHARDRDIGHRYESSGETFIRRGLPTIFDDV